MQESEELAEFTDGDSGSSSTDGSDFLHFPEPTVRLPLIPEDILVIIFDIAFDGRLHDSVSWSQVCQHWRSTALGMPSLWASFSSARGAAVAIWQLARVKPTTRLSVTIIIYDHPTAASYEKFLIRSGVWEHPGGWKDVEVQAITNAHMSQACAGIAMRSDELDSLTMHMADLDEDSHHLPGFSLMFRPRALHLRTVQLWLSLPLVSRLEVITVSNMMSQHHTYLRLSPMDLSQTLISLSSLTSLTLCNYPINQLLSKAVAPKLKQLKLQSCSGLTESWARSTEITMDLVAAFAPTLEYLDMQSGFTQRTQWRLLPETLRVLCLTQCLFWSGPIIRGLCAGLPPRLQQLILCDYSISKEHLMALFETQVLQQQHNSLILERITLVDGPFNGRCVARLRYEALHVVVEQRTYFPEFHREKLPKVELEWIRPDHQQSIKPAGLEIEVDGQPYTVVENLIEECMGASDRGQGDERDVGWEGDDESDKGKTNTDEEKPPRRLFVARPPGSVYTMSDADSDSDRGWIDTD